MRLQTSDVFGVSTKIKPASYVDRGSLDRRLGLLLERDTHIALRGESKVGKSWLRQKLVSNPIVVQCRHRTKVEDIYISALSEIGVSFTIERQRTHRHVSAEEWEAFVESHRVKCLSKPPAGIAVSSIDWQKEGDLLADPDEFDPNDDWEVLGTGKDAGQFNTSNRTVSLTGGARYQVQLADPAEIPDGEGGPDAPHSFTGILVAVSAQAGMVALDADGNVRIARGHEISAVE